MYRVFQKFVYRLPLFPVNFLTNFMDKNENDMWKVIDNIKIKEVIYIASPILYEEIEKVIAGQIRDEKKKKKILLSCIKYLSRMCTRCTPFGLFATCSVGHWGKNTNFIVNTQYERVVRPDMFFLCELTQNLLRDNTLREKLKYFPNTTIYEIGNKLRYILYHYRNGRRLHTITSVQKSSYLNAILKMATQGCKIEELIKYLISKGHEIEDARLYIYDLIDSQILISELEPNTTGIFYLEQVINKLKETAKPLPITQLLCEWAQRFKDANKNKGNCCIEKYKTITEDSSIWKIPIKEGLLLQVDTTRKDFSCILNKDIIKELQEIIELWERISVYQPNSNLQKFQEAFNERYEEHEIPLSIALDPEIGIGYPIRYGVGDINPLLDQLILPRSFINVKDRNISLSTVLLKKMMEMKAKGEKEIHLSMDDFKEMPFESRHLPSTIYIMAQFVQNEQEEIFIHVKSISSMPANLLARFFHLNNEIEKLVLDITQKECEHRSDGIIAEIAHLPNSRIGNILSRPHFRDYEIIYLANSDLSSSKKISLSDLMLSCKRGELILRSKTLNKRIYPRLTTAHNYYNDTLPIYRFLCDLQHQEEGRYFGLNWGGIEESLKYKPRIYFQKFILCSASWTVEMSEIRHLYMTKEDILIEEVRKWRNERKIPAQVLLADGDNELFIDLDKLLCIQVLLSTVKKRVFFTLTEYLFRSKKWLVHGKNANEGFVNEFIIPFYKEYEK